ncbi:amino acid deaminase [Mitsuaria sp. GD03876]|uniref:amino acid deaminase n=1 Tax=Mitsuaria sp. GD03876 TaxID=2975399 RepID=UPI002447A2B8|nr:amino acid deaminase [Mitsuaria sp. GD03876]MDH0866719.1 amino acid deaminase [Mitsuaria sp. GD03876]
MTLPTPTASPDDRPDHASVSLRLAPLLAEPLPPTLKGLPAIAEGVFLQDLDRLKLSLLDGDLPLPAAVLKDSALRHNARWMREFTERAGVSLAPHGKTTMAPQLFQRQFDEGAWGMTAATAAHVRTYRRFGVPRVLLANQLVGKADVELVFRELEADPDFDFYLLVDSIAGLELLRRAAAGRGLRRPLQILLEVGTPGGRSGVRTLEEGIALGQAIHDAAPAIALRGVEAFEGVYSGSDTARVELGALTMIETVAELTRLGCAQGWFAPGEVLLTAGGSAFFDMAARTLAAVEAAGAGHALRVVLRSGCYLSHDSLQYERMQDRMRQRAGALWGDGPGLRNAIEVWAHVQSVPEPGRAICTAGRRDLSYDACLPQPLWWFRPGLHEAPQATPSHWSVTKLNDQHAYVDATGEGAGALPLQVGDLIAFGIGHPCTTFDKWPLLYTVDDGYRVIGGVRTFF